MGDRGLKNKLTAVQIKRTEAGKLFDGGGLTLVKDGPTGKWVYRYSHLGKRREMGLGAWPAVSLADARKERDRWAGELARGMDPITARKAAQEDAKAERDKSDPSFADAVHIVFQARKDSLRGGGKRGRWLSPLDQHVTPKIGRKPISTIHQTDIRDAIAPLWRKMHPTGLKAIQRTRIVFQEMQLMGYDCDPFTVDAARRMLGVVKHTATPTPATDWRDIPDLFASLDSKSSADQCLRWMILTLVRLDGCAGAAFAEIDGTVWTVPADRVKGMEANVTDFRVPLPQACLRIAEEQAQFHDTLLFPSHTGRPITSRGLEVRLDKLKEPGRPHGFRTSFRTWAQDTDACSWEVAETILNHKIGSKVERAYARSDLLERRAPVMEAWARYVTRDSASSVAPLRA